MTYPVVVEEISNKVIDVLSQDNYVEDDIKIIYLDKLRKFFFNKWLVGEELVINEDQCNDIYIECMSESILDGLIEQGIYGIIEDENGDEIVFVTQKGKELGY